MFLEIIRVVLLEFHRFSFAEIISISRVAVVVLAEIKPLIVLVHSSTPERERDEGFIGRRDPSDGRLKSMRRRRLSRNSARLATY